ncbi:MAG TPA: hypothetical protein VFA67_09050 [Candidatus Sulfotelmatobacter sp.]|nr:hypothetical protein [Candidatus Sulfotelmatobacter sp.]
MLERYEKELVGQYVSDPLGTRIWFMDYNFPKLIQLHYNGNKARASKALEHFRSEGRRDETGYSYDESRFSTLFWIPDIMTTPDSIHTNRHGRILGDEVYVKRYAKGGACFKIVFTEIDAALNQRIVTTSFMTQSDRLEEFVTMPPKWERKERPQPKEEQLDLSLESKRKEPH